MKFAITYYDEIEAEDETEAKQILLHHLERDANSEDVSCWDIKVVE